MARNQPFDFSDDDDFNIGSHGTHGTHSAHSSNAGYGSTEEMYGSAELADADLIGETGAQQGNQMGDTAAQQKQAAQTQTAARSTTSQQHDSPTSMQHKRGNQPR